MKHTPQSAAKAVKAMLNDSIARTWEQYHAPGYKLNAYQATKLVQEQCNGIDRKQNGGGKVADGPFSFEACSVAVAAEMPELFAEYWEVLPA